MTGGRDVGVSMIHLQLLQQQTRASTWTCLLFPPPSLPSRLPDGGEELSGVGPAHSRFTIPYPSPSTNTSTNQRSTLTHTHRIPSHTVTHVPRNTKLSLSMQTPADFGERFSLPPVICYFVIVSRSTSRFLAELTRFMVVGGRYWKDCYPYSGWAEAPFVFFFFS